MEIDRARLETLAPVNLPPAPEPPAVELDDTRAKAPSQRTCSDCGAQTDKRTCPKCGSPTLLDEVFDKDPLVGRVLDERFEILERLGGGGFGTVYHARQLSVKRDVALKVIRSEWRGDREMAKRFVREAQLVSRLEHPNTIRVFDFGQGADGELYLTMELLRGETLTQRLVRVGQLSPPDAARLLACVARSLDEAHAQGIVHRDLKPDNVFLHRPSRGEEVVKVLDFGIAKVTQDGSSVYQTGSLRMLGTPLYMAPEQIRSDPVDGRADLYALGVMLHELLTGRPPFDGASQAEVWHRHQTAPPPELPAAVPTGLRALCTRLLAKRRDDRPASAEAVLGALDEAAMSRTAPEPKPAPRPEPRKPEPAPLPEPEPVRRPAREPEARPSPPRPNPPAAPDPGPGPQPASPGKVAPSSPPPRAAPIARETDLVRPAPRQAPAPAPPVAPPESCPVAPAAGPRPAPAGRDTAFLAWSPPKWAPPEPPGLRARRSSIRWGWVFGLLVVLASLAAIGVAIEIGRRANLRVERGRHTKKEMRSDCQRAVDNLLALAKSDTTEMGQIMRKALADEKLEELARECELDVAKHPGGAKCAAEAASLEGFMACGELAR